MFPAWSVHRSHGKDVEVSEEGQLMEGAIAPVFSQNMSAHTSTKHKEKSRSQRYTTDPQLHTTSSGSCLRTTKSWSLCLGTDQAHRRVLCRLGS